MSTSDRRPYYTAFAVWFGLFSISPHVHFAMLDGAIQNILAVTAAIFAGLAFAAKDTTP